MDAVNRGIDLLQEQPVTLRRVILILSQPQDVGSTTLPPERLCGVLERAILLSTASPFCPIARQ
jgi:hypothetical protein